MHLRNITIKNFRGLENIQAEFEDGVNVIVGPNAIGKTTVLEAIRLAKALLAPRTQNEPNQTLMALGALVPYDPSQVLIDAIARTLTQPIEIRCRYELSSAEITKIELGIPEIVRSLVLGNIGQGFSNPASLISFLSSSQGQAATAQADAQVRLAFEDIKRQNKSCRLDLVIDPTSADMQNLNPLDVSFFSFLERSLPPNLTTFSYFPADRALPPGEQPVQLGAADTNNQVESHNSQPQLKYTRLKTTIFNAVVMSPEDRTSLSLEFEKIFRGILKGRRLVGVGVNRHGLLSVVIEDIDTGRQFSLDGMSSGEKGLILTFLLIARSITNDGMILLDEPELHLNPAVCKDLLSFLVDEYILPKHIQAIVCSHSAEILAGAFDRDACTLYHLISESNLTRVRYKDQDVIAEALRTLGTSETEGLLYKATIFVEGKEDVELLQAGFGELLRRYMLKDRDGRKEIEKQIKLLQDAEKRGDKISARFFVFDRDEDPSQLNSSELIRVLQWERRNFENYLIDIDVLTDVLKDHEMVQKPLANEGEVSKLLRELAMSQLDEVVCRRIYEGYAYENPGLRVDEVKGKSLDDSADLLLARLQRLRGQFQNFDSQSWKSRFKHECEKEREKLKPIWESTWQKDCDGKRLFKDVQQRVHPKTSLLRMKKRIITEMRINKTENWRSVESLLKSLLTSKP